jgi:hypothetical protein
MSQDPWIYRTSGRGFAFIRRLWYSKEPSLSGIWRSRKEVKSYQSELIRADRIKYSKNRAEIILGCFGVLPERNFLLVFSDNKEAKK